MWAQTKTAIFRLWLIRWQIGIYNIQFKTFCSQLISINNIISDIIIVWSFIIGHSFHIKYNNLSVLIALYELCKLDFGCVYVRVCVSVCSYAFDIMCHFGSICKALYAHSRHLIYGFDYADVLNLCNQQTAIGGWLRVKPASTTRAQHILLMSLIHIFDTSTFVCLTKLTWTYFCSQNPLDCD